jgi:uncharacterized protein YciI
MYIVLLKFSGNKNRADQFLEGHRLWIKRGFDEGVFLMAGSLQPALGGGILAHNTSMRELQARLGEDPFVVENVVRAEIFEMAPAKADERLAFLLAPSPEKKGSP